MAKQIGIIGIGLLGSALVERLLLARYEVVGFDRDESRLASFAERGGQPLASALDVAKQSTRVVLSLPNSAIVEQVVSEISPALSADSIVIDTTTGSPDKTTAIAEKLKSCGTAYLDATVAGSSEQARAGDIVIMVGGEPRAFESCRDIFDALAHQIFHVGPSGSGAQMKLVVNLVLGLNRAALAEGLTLARAVGIDLTKALEVLRSGAAYSVAMDTKGRKMIEEDFTPQARLAQHHKDVGLILELAARTGVELPLSQTHDELLRVAGERGFADADNSAIIKAFGIKAFD